MAGVFGRAADRYDRVGPALFATLGKRLVGLAELPAGARVLDVATGTGAALVPAAEAVGVDGHVLGIDLSPEMVHEARERIAARGLHNAEARVMDAERLDHLPDAAFHAVLCGFSLAFFPDPGRALAEFRRVLRPDGVMAASTWREVDESWAWFPELLREHGVTPRRLIQRPFDDPEELAEALRYAGFEQVRVVVEELAPAAPPDDWWEWLWTQGQRAALEAMDERTLAAFRAACTERLGRMSDGGIARRSVQALFALASRGG